MIRALFAAMLVLLAGCEVRFSTGTTLRPSERIPVQIMCPGAAPFAGWMEYSAKLMDGSGRAIGNSSRCAWVETGEPQKKD